MLTPKFHLFVLFFFFYPFPTLSPLKSLCVLLVIPIALCIIVLLLSLSLSLTPHNHQFAIYPHPLNEANVIKSTIRNKARVISRDQDYYYFSSSEFSNTADWIDGQIYFFLNLIIGSSLATLYTDSNLSRSKQ